MHVVMVLLLIPRGQPDNNVPDFFRMGNLAESESTDFRGRLHIDIAEAENELKKSLQFAGHVLNLK